jgi:hypothetical protein
VFTFVFMSPIKSGGLCQHSNFHYRLALLYNIPHILESNPHPFYSCRGLKGQMRIRIKCGFDSRSRAGVWPNDRTGVRAVRTIQGGKNEVQIRLENIRYLLIQFYGQSCLFYSTK